MTPKIHDAELIDAALTDVLIFSGLTRKVDRLREHIAGQAELLNKYREHTGKLLKLMGMLDPNCGEDRHPEWPLQLRGDEDATKELCEVLNKLQELK